MSWGEVPVRCPACGEVFELATDSAAGAAQARPLECPTCRRPLVARIRFDEWGDPEVEIERA